MPFPLFAAANIASGLIGGVTGLIQQHKAKKLLKNLQYPTETIPREYLENQGLAKSMANTGLPSEQYNNAMKNIQRQQMMALKSANDRRGGLAILPGLADASNQATANLDTQDAQARMANQRNLMNVNNQVAGVKRSIFDQNVRQKYNRDYAYAMGLMGAGGENFTSGLDKLATGGLGLIGGGGLFGGSKGGASRQYNTEYMTDIMPYRKTTSGIPNF